MPTYEYACLSCGTHVEVYQRFSEEPLTVCGVCGGPLRKVFHPAGILFKGSGFYATDSRASRTRERAGSDGRDGEKGGEGEKGETTASEKAGSTTGSGSTNGSDSRGGSGSRSGSGSTGEKGSRTGSTSRRESSKKREPKGEGSTKEKSA